jgi:hypothetical protein
MRITERIGGLNRPRISEEVCMTPCTSVIKPVSLTLL